MVQFATSAVLRVRYKTGSCFEWKILHTENVIFVYMCVLSDTVFELNWVHVAHITVELNNTFIK